MPLFEIARGELVPFRRLKGGADLYEKEIENLVWANLEEFTGETLFPIRRQAKLPLGGIPDILALDKTGRVVVLEIKRDVDRHQLAQCLEYAGWGRNTSLDELAGLYHASEDAFWADWQQFTGSDTPVLVNPQPRLVLVARDFEERTRSALNFLIDAGVPVSLIGVSIYEDETGRRFVDVEGDHEPEAPSVEEPKGSPHWKYQGRRMRLADLLEHGLLEPGDELVWDRPKVGTHYTATVLESGAVQLPDGREVSSPSRAAMLASDVRTPNGELQAFDGWYAWTVKRLGKGKTLNDLRVDLREMIDQQAELSE